MNICECVVVCVCVFSVSCAEGMSCSGRNAPRSVRLRTQACCSPSGLRDLERAAGGSKPRLEHCTRPSHLPCSVPLPHLRPLRLSLLVPYPRLKSHPNRPQKQAQTAPESAQAHRPASPTRRSAPACARTRGARRVGGSSTSLFLSPLVLFVVVVVVSRRSPATITQPSLSLVLLYAEQRARSAPVLGGGEDHKFPLRAKTWMMVCPRGEDDHIITLVMEGEVGGSMRRPFEGNRQRKSWSGDIWGKSRSQKGVTSSTR
jgi:hypothetical protein